MWRHQIQGFKFVFGGDVPALLITGLAKPNRSRTVTGMAEYLAVANLLLFRLLIHLLLLAATAVVARGNTVCTESAGHHG